MLELLFRKIFYKDLSKEEQDVVLLLKDRYRMELIAVLIILILILIPYYVLALTVIHLLNIKNNVLLYFGFILLSSLIYDSILIKFRSKIFLPRYKISNFLYVHFFVTRGNAISKKDFKLIKKQDKSLYYHIITQETQGFCYFTSFSLLKCLQKGCIKFIAIKNIKPWDNSVETKEYTMHIMYVHNNWCFDTFSQRQYPLDYVLKHFYAKEYKSFYLKDINCSFEEFVEAHKPDLEKWCTENNCFTFNRKNN